MFDNISETIREAQRKLFERKARLGENIVIVDENGRPIVIKAEEYLSNTNKK